jgi:hypothetical protein
MGHCIFSISKKEQTAQRERMALGVHRILTWMRLDEKHTKLDLLAYI